MTLCLRDAMAKGRIIRQSVEKALRAQKKVRLNERCGGQGTDI
jgi:hypothetical protein